ncbi:hypothetical protein [Sporomusa aerivorans]|uniref:hypothetical protein n=1 Tax=Sporomusa aerivorans TaxID=204936 RepID=UPI00352B98F5
MIEKIYSLREQMVKLGYAIGEIDAWIRHVMGDIPIDQLDNQDCLELIDNLNSYILFAKKARQLPIENTF